MKLLKKLTALVIAVALVMALGITAFAADPTLVDITIEGAKKDATYTAYRLLDTTVSLKVAGCHKTEAEHTSACYLIGYTKNTMYWDILKSLTGESSEIDVYNYIQGLTSADAIYDFAEDVYDALTGKTADATVTAAADGPVKLENVIGGYWLIVETTGEGYEGVHSLLILDTVGKRDITVHTKRDTLTLEKKVQDNGATYGMFADHEIGENANYWILADVPDHTEGFEYYTYTIHDKMEPGLTFNNDIKVELNYIGGGLLDPTYYTVTTNCEDKCTFHINVDMKQAIADGALKGQDRLYILYTAKLNSGASVIKDGTDIQNANGNEAWLQYSNNPHVESETIETVHSHTYVWTFRMNLIKVDYENTQLEGAKFVLSLNGNLTENDLNKETQNTSQLIPLVEVAKNHYHISDGTATNPVYSIEVGNASIGGFDDQTDYYLYEIKAPDGYNRLNAPTLIKFTASYSATPSATEHFTPGYPQITVGNNPASSVLEARVVNQTGTELPSTGGIGTTIFYVLGGIMVVGAAVLLITKKRMGAEV